MRYQDCSICSSLNDYERAFQKSGEGTFLPPAAGKLIPLYRLESRSFDLGGNPPLRVDFSRLAQLQECPQCQTLYLYWTDYEFLWGGSEDEETLERLTDEQVLACLEKLELTALMPPSQSPQPTPVERFAKELEEDKNYIIRRLKEPLASGDYEGMQAALKSLDGGTYDFPELIPILEKTDDAAFYYFDDNGAGGFPRADIGRGEYSLKEEALSAIEKIKKKCRL